MRFFIRKRSKPPTVIIVALIDILIVLLIFLMVTSTFKQRPALKLALPESTQATKTEPCANETAPLIVAIDDRGNLRLGVEAKPVTVDRLKAELLAQVEKNPQLKLAISADKNAPFGQVVKVMDATREAGIKSVNAFTKEVTK